MKKFKGFDPPPGKRQTSRAAADSIKSTVHLKRAKVYAYIKKSGARGATCDEVEAALRMPHQTASARVNELHWKFKAIKDSGRRRRTRNGCTATVWLTSNRRMPPPTQTSLNFKRRQFVS